MAKSRMQYTVVLRRYKVGWVVKKEGNEGKVAVSIPIVNKI